MKGKTTKKIQNRWYCQVFLFQKSENIFPSDRTILVHHMECMTKIPYAFSVLSYTFIIQVQ